MREGLEKRMKLEDMSCIDCAAKSCRAPGNEYPPFCLTTHMDQKILNDAMACYQEEENHRIAVAAAEVEHEFYCKHTRVEEIMDFARKIGAKKIGIATCIGLLRESRILAEIFRKNGCSVRRQLQGRGPVQSQHRHSGGLLLHRPQHVQPDSPGQAAQ